ncbi:hypothetical protein P7K49_004883, partial [Saguinus oedipus]
HKPSRDLAYLGFLESHACYHQHKDPERNQVDGWDAAFPHKELVVGGELPSWVRHVTD